MSDVVHIVEMAARDGLQNERRTIATADKIRLIDLLSACGFARIEATSFVSAKWVPQLADAARVMAGIVRRPGVAYAALTPNLQGYRAAREAGADEVAIFAAASEGFSRANINCSIAESLDRFRPVAEASRADGVPLRGYVSCAVVCPYDGPTPPGAVAQVADALFAMGCHEVSLGDTVGRGTPQTVAAMLDAVLAAAPAARLAGHFHDTGGQALANIRVALDRGLRVFDSAVGGLGGCPYAPGAPGNVDTLAVAAMLYDEGYRTGLNREALTEAALFARTLVGPRRGEGTA